MPKRWLFWPERPLMQRAMQAHPTMPRRWRDVVERLLPWFDPERERQHNDRTEAIRQRSIATRIRAEGVVDDYRAADRVVRRER